MQAFVVEYRGAGIFRFCSLKCAEAHNIFAPEGEFVLEAGYPADEKCANCRIILNDAQRAIQRTEAVISIAMTEAQTPRQRLEYLRGELQAERISYDELAELQSLASHIDPADIELREAAGIPEPYDEEFTDHPEIPPCPACSNGYGAALGQLGNLVHFRCRSCGYDFNLPA